MGTVEKKAKKKNVKEKRHKGGSHEHVKDKTKAKGKPPKSVDPQSKEKGKKNKGKKKKKKDTRKKKKTGAESKASHFASKNRSKGVGRIWGGTGKSRYNQTPSGFDKWQPTDRELYEKVTRHLRNFKIERWQCSAVETKHRNIDVMLRSVGNGKQHKFEMAAYEKASREVFPTRDELVDLPY